MKSYVSQTTLYSPKARGYLAKFSVSRKKLQLIVDHQTSVSVTSVSDISYDTDIYAKFLVSCSLKLIFLSSKNPS